VFQFFAYTSNFVNEITRASITLKCEGFFLALHCQELLCDICSHVYPATMVMPDILTVVLLRMQVLWKVMTCCWVMVPDILKDCIKSLALEDGECLSV